MLWTALILGLAGSFHCVGMCGPIALVLPVNKQNKKIFSYQVFLYHLGKTLTYSLIGLLFGLLGKGLYLSGFQQRLSILMGIIMIVAVVFPVSKLNSYHITKPLYKAIEIVKKKLGLHLSKRSNKSIFLIGFFNGFLPCGLVYIALIGAITTGSHLNGAIYMALFGIGTIPLLTATIVLGNFVTLTVRNKIQKAMPLFVVVIGLLFILRGLGLGIPYISPSDAKLQVNSNPANCVTIDEK